MGHGPDAPAAMPASTDSASRHREPGAHAAQGRRDWAWRARIRRNPRTAQVYRTVVGIFGGVIVIGGLIAVPFPGPGWLIVFIGVSIWASEFHWARRLHTYGMERLARWTAWVQRQSLLVRGALFLSTCAFVNAFLWVSLKLTGVPGWVPADVAAWMQAHLAL